MQYGIFPGREFAELERPTKKMSLAEIRRALAVDAKYAHRDAPTVKLPKVQP